MASHEKPLSVYLLDKDCNHLFVSLKGNQESILSAGMDIMLKLKQS